ncbi:hypothetical protein HJC23_013454 [Cyclotella cryptica]|uniref:EamA domain-containing protein n=1 Tax=Cyclotella cryptica TaxID=29204 RepID=A0ABD3NZI5_9STRA
MPMSCANEQAISPRYITGAEIGLCTLLEAVLGPLFVFFAFDEIPSQWTLIGGSLLLFILAAHESRPLFEKAREQYRSMSTRFSSRMSGVIIQEVESSLGVSKSDVEGGKMEVDESFVEDQSPESPEAHATCTHD